jgi:hypothetical protein
MWQYHCTDELYHHGVKGQKWGVRRYRRKDGTLTRAGRKRYGDDRHEDYKKVHDKKRVEYMSDNELRARNNRLQMERQHKDLTKKTSVGKKAVNTFVATAGTITAVMGAYKVYEKLAKSVLDKIGKKAV